ncbi:MAG: enoyl-CoA hydratase/isomerase family protein, partial [Salaquimonas sp.]
MNAGDAVLAGFADVQVAISDLDALKSAIEKAGDISVLANFAGPPDAPSLAPHMEAIDRHFSKNSAVEVLKSLEEEAKEDGSDWANETIKLLRRSCPLSVACAFEMIRRIRGKKSVEEALAMEYRFTHRSMSDGELIEGIRAQIIDKDRNPQWHTARLEDVSQEQIAKMLAPLGERELEFPLN